MTSYALCARIKSYTKMSDKMRTGAQISTRFQLLISLILARAEGRMKHHQNRLGLGYLMRPHITLIP